MANARVSHMPGRIGQAPSSSPRAAQVVRRRRVFMCVASTVVLLIAVLANYGPLSAYYDAKGRLESATEAVAELKLQKTSLEAELGRLSESGYLESLARQDLAYTRPGEELYIVTGMASADVGGLSGLNGAGAQTGQGFLERVLEPLLDGR